MATGHPPWFHPGSFGQAVLKYTLWRMNWLPPEHSIQLDDGSEFHLAVRSVGNAVYTLQVIMRDRLRSIFIESIHLVAGVVDGHNHEEIIQFMTQGYLETDVFNFVLSNFAVIAELIIFLSDLGIPIPHYLYHVPWCHIYSHRLRDVVAIRGGFNELVKAAQRRYEDNYLHSDVLVSRVLNAPIPHAEVHGVNNWPQNPAAFLQEIFEEPPPSMTLAMDILRNLYTHKPGLVPLPEEQHLWLPL